MNHAPVPLYIKESRCCERCTVIVTVLRHGVVLKVVGEPGRYKSIHPVLFYQCKLDLVLINRILFDLAHDVKTVTIFSKYGMVHYTQKEGKLEKQVNNEPITRLHRLLQRCVAYCEVKRLTDVQLGVLVSKLKRMLGS